MHFYGGYSFFPHLNNVVILIPFLSCLSISLNCSYWHDSDVRVFQCVRMDNFIFFIFFILHKNKSFCISYFHFKDEAVPATSYDATS